MKLRIIGCIAAVLLAESCGYHVAGKAKTIPKGIQTIAVPALTSTANQYRLPDQLAVAIGREFTTRTRFRIVQSPSEADAVLHGAINSVTIFPTVSDPSTGKATSVAIQVVLTISLTERTSGRVLYSQPGMVVKSYYEISTDPHQTFDESGPSMRRLSEEVARTVVAGVVEGF